MLQKINDKSRHPAIPAEAPYGGVKKISRENLKTEMNEIRKSLR